jgi:hypothetical protein
MAKIKSKSKAKKLLKDIKPIPDETTQNEEFIEWLFDLIAEDDIKELNEVMTPRILAEYGVLEALLKNPNISSEAYKLCYELIGMAQVNMHKYDYSVVMSEAVYAILETSDNAPEYNYNYYNGNKWNLLKLVFNFNIDIMQLISDLNTNYFKEYIKSRPDFLCNLLYTILKSHHKIYFKKIDIFNIIDDLTETSARQVYRYLLDTNPSFSHELFMKQSSSGMNSYDKVLIKYRVALRTSVYTEHPIDYIISYLNDEMVNIENDKKVDTANYSNFLIFKFVDFDAERKFHSKLKEANYLERLENIKQELFKKEEKGYDLMENEIRVFELYTHIENYLKMIDDDIKEMRKDIKLELDNYTPLIPDLQNIVVDYL